MLAGLRNPRLLRLALVFAASTVAAGVLVTFVPLAVTTATATAALIGLLAATAGYPAAFVITAALVLPALVPVLRERSRPAHAAAPGRAELITRR